MSMARAVKCSRPFLTDVGCSAIIVRIHRAHLLLEAWDPQGPVGGHLMGGHCGGDSATLLAVFLP